MSKFHLNRRQFIALSAGVSASTQLGWTQSATTSSRLLTGTIPSSGEQIPYVGIGTNRWVSDSSAEEQAVLRSTLQQFYELGGRVIDTAPAYRSSETALGKLITELGIHDAFFLATKIDRQQQDEALAQMQKSLSYLQTKNLDVLQVHNLNGAETILDTLFEWRESGTIRYVGITTSRVSQFAEMEQLMKKFPLDFVQLNYSLLDREAEQRLLPLAADKKTAVLVNLPFARGKIFRTTKEVPLPQLAADLGCTSWAQYALKFVISHPAVTCAIPGMTKPNHVRDNLNAASGILPDAQQRELMAAEFSRLV